MFVARDGSLKSPTLVPTMYPRTYMPPMAGGWPSAYGGIYERQLWVYVVVRKRAMAVARLPLKVYERDDLNRPGRSDHPMARLLDHPNGAMSGFDLKLWTSSTLDVFGEAFWLKDRRNGKVVGLYPLHPASMTHDENGWSFNNGKLSLPSIADGDLVKFTTYNPSSLVRGLSPLEPLRATLENEWSARTATSSFWQRGARPGFALSHPNNISEMAAQRLKAQMDAAHGGAGRTGGTLVLEEGMKAEPLELTAEDAQYIETRKLNREEVCAAYDVPPPVVHILDRATYSNITEQMRSMYRDTMAPVLRALESSIELDLRAAEWPTEPVYAEFLMDEVLRGDFESRQDALNKAAHMTLAEKRRLENLPFIEGTDRIFLNTATMPLDAIDRMSNARADQLLAITPARSDADARSVLGRLGWQKRLADVDVEKVTEGLAYLEGTVMTCLAESSSVKELRARLIAALHEEPPDA